MGTERPKSKMLTGMTNRQKIMALVTVIIFLFVGWQIIGMFSGGGTPTPPPSPNVATRTTPPGAARAPGAMSATAPRAPGQPAPVAQPPAAVAIQQASLRQPDTAQKVNDILKTQEQTQKTYVQAITDLQLLRLEREKAEMNQAIAAARLATVTAEKNISDLLSKPTPTYTPASAFGAQMGSTVTGQPLPGPGGVPIAPPTATTVTTATVTSPPPAPIVEVVDIPYTVVSVVMQFNKWTAVLGYKNDTYTVSVGDTLPIDGSKVVSISRSGVVLRKDGKTRRISLITSI